MGGAWASRGHAAVAGAFLTLWPRAEERPGRVCGPRGARVSRLAGAESGAAEGPGELGPCVWSGTTEARGERDPLRARAALPAARGRAAAGLAELPPPGTGDLGVL